MLFFLIKYWIKIKGCTLNFQKRSSMDQNIHLFMGHKKYSKRLFNLYDSLKKSLFRCIYIFFTSMHKKKKKKKKKSIEFYECIGTSFFFHVLKRTWPYIWIDQQKRSHSESKEKKIEQKIFLYGLMRMLPEAGEREKKKEKNLANQE